MMDTSSPTPFSSDYSFLNSASLEPYLTYPTPSSHYEMHSVSQTSPRLSFNTLGLPNAGMPYYPSYTTSRNSPRPFSPVSISPPLLNAAELSGDGLASNGGRTSRESSSPASSSNGGSLVHRHPMRSHSHSHSLSSASSNSGRERSNSTRRRPSRMDDFGSDDEDLDVAPMTAEVVVQRRREEIRRQRIESEQRRRDELRDGYRRLKDVLPVSNQKSSKVSLLDRATTHIKYLEVNQQQMLTKIQELEAETQRLRNINETLMLSAAERRPSSASLASSNF
jgi:hypothetical protein